MPGSHLCVHFISDDVHEVVVTFFPAERVSVTFLFTAAQHRSSFDFPVELERLLLVKTEEVASIWAAPEVLSDEDSHVPQQTQVGL